MEAIYFLLGAGIVLAALYPQIRNLQKQVETLQGSLYHRIGYFPAVQNTKSPQNAPNEQEKPIKKHIDEPNLLELQEKAMADLTVDAT